jgi:uncharacterized Zn finger protein
LFDPTAFDNWKVVVEGAMYDLDREGIVLVAGREDLVDLAGMSRSFRISVRLPEEDGRAELRMYSDMTDFVGERHEIRLTEEPPGIRVEVRLILPGERVRDVTALHEKLEPIWEADAEVHHTVRVTVDPHNPQALAAPGDSEYVIRIPFRDKWGEDRISDIGVLQERLLESLRIIRRS